MAERAKAVESRISSLNDATKKQREKVLAQAYVDDGEQQVKEMEQGLEK